MSLPTGVVTLLLADVESSTRLWETQPEQMTAAFAALDRTLTAAVAAHGGARPVEQGEGDSFVVAFACASDAVACALDLQRAPLAPIRLRIGIHTGEVQLRNEGNYIGPTINKTARVRDLGHGGQTLLSAATEEIIADRLPPGAWLTELGAYPLRGVARPERIVQLSHVELCDEFPPLRAADVIVAHSLPAQLTTFIGRGEQIKEVRRVLGANRLVTLTGAGGAGKTRLSLEIAEQMAIGFSDGVWFVDLAPISEPDMVAGAVARALGLPHQHGPSTVGTVLRYIGHRHMLVVMDNCEHVLDTCAELTSQLLVACPGLTVLATSREPLGVLGEVTWRIPSLSIVDEAIQLFTDRARRARPEFTVDANNLATVTEICRRLDGMPLAIELAAARVRALSLSEILEGLQNRFHLLTGGARTALPRQQTLRASVDWSHALLPEDERILFRRLALFMGGFDLDAACTVAADGVLTRFEVLDQLTQLVDKSLLVAEDDGGHTRYRLLETVRQYAVEKLEAVGEADAVRKRHRDYYLARVDKMRTRTQVGFEQSMQRGVTEFDDLRAAFTSSAKLGADPAMLIKAARAAAWLLELALAEELADAALRAGAGMEAEIVRAQVLSLMGRGEEADAVLVAARRGALSEADHATVVFLQAVNRLFTLADPMGAQSLVDRASRRIGHKHLGYVAAWRTVYAAVMGEPAIARETAAQVDWEQMPDLLARVGAWAATVALGDAGHTAAALDRAAAGYPIPVRGYFVIADAHVGALLLAGRISEAENIAQRFGRRAADFPRSRWDPIFTAIAGRTAVAGGRLRDALVLLDSASERFAALGYAHGWRYRTELLRATALAITRCVNEAVESRRALEELRHPGWRHLDYEWAITQAWIAACDGDVDDAIVTVLSAAEEAGVRGQFAAEVLCRQIATQFGDESSAARLRELTHMVEGPRAALAARFSAALDAGDRHELASVSDDFERMGDLVAALDAAAYAGRIERAEDLADRCGAQTPALRLLSSID